MGHFSCGPNSEDLGEVTCCAMTPLIAGAEFLFLFSQLQRGIKKAYLNGATD